jgi:serine/threonine-protein kinase
MQGKILGGRYRLVHQLGKGGMGAVWTAEHLALHSAVAVKLLDSEIAKHPEAVERFQREAQAAATLRSAHVVQVLDYGVDGTTPYLVMELLQGEDLGARLGRVGRLSPRALVEIMEQVARAVGRAHSAGIVHRDLKPENIFLVNEGDHELVKVLDFGIAKSVAPGFAPSATRTGVTMGTPYYMSPEQAEGKREVDQRTDLWALGVIASECLTGIRPFDGETFGELLLNICARAAPIPSTLAEVPRHFDAWFAKATQRDAGRRFGTVVELVSTLREVAEGRSVPGLEGPAMKTAPMDGPVPGMQQSWQARAPEIARTAGNVALTLSGDDDPPELPVSGRGLIAGAAVLLLVLVAAGGWWFWSEPTGSGEQPLPSTMAAAAHTTSLEPHAASQGEAQQAEPVPVAAPAVPARPSAVGARNDSARSAGQDASSAQHLSAARKPAPDPRPAPEPTAAATKARPAAPSKPITLRCVSDPFTGTLRPTTANEPKSLACKQNPFSGQYQRL